MVRLQVEERSQGLPRAKLADRSYVMNNGEIRAQLAPEEAGDMEKITTAYFGATTRAEGSP